MTKLTVAFRNFANVLPRYRAQMTWHFATEYHVLVLFIVKLKAIHQNGNFKIATFFCATSLFEILWTDIQIFHVTLVASYIEKSLSQL
jgi:hypothetical protein